MIKTRPRTWNPWYWDAAISWGTQVCIEHKGEHRWDWLDASTGFCVGAPVLPGRKRWQP